MNAPLVAESIMSEDGIEKSVPRITQIMDLT